MIRLVAPTRNKDACSAWLVIEGDDRHGYLVRAFDSLDSLQVSDDWVQVLSDAFLYGERCGVQRGDWRPRQEPLPGGVPFPDMGEWTPDNSAYD